MCQLVIGQGLQRGHKPGILPQRSLLWRRRTYGARLVFVLHHIKIVLLYRSLPSLILATPTEEADWQARKRALQGRCSDCQAHPVRLLPMAMASRACWGTLSNSFLPLLAAAILPHRLRAKGLLGISILSQPSNPVNTRDTLTARPWYFQSRVVDPTDPCPL